MAYLWLYIGDGYCFTNFCIGLRGSFYEDWQLGVVVTGGRKALLFGGVMESCLQAIRSLFPFSNLNKIPFKHVF